MKALLICIVGLLLAPTLMNGQIAGKKSKEPYMLFDSIKVSPGDTIYLAYGSDRKGDFVSIFQPANYLLGAQEASLPRNYANKYFEIKHFKVQTDKKTGSKTVAVVTPGGFNYIADLEQGINLKEIAAINSTRFDKKEEVKVVVNTGISLADELAKLKKLFSDSVLTKDEYEAAKKKLLGN